MTLSAHVTLEWWANQLTCLGSFAARIEIHEDSSDLTATGALTPEELTDPEAVKGWELLCGISPVFRLVFDDGSEFEVRVHLIAETGAFALTECTGGTPGG